MFTDIPNSKCLGVHMYIYLVIYSKLKSFKIIARRFEFQFRQRYSPPVG